MVSESSSRWHDWHWHELQKWQKKKHIWQKQCIQLKSNISNHKYKCYLRTVGKRRLSVSNNSSSHKDTLGIRAVVHKSWITVIVVLWCRFVIFWVWHLPFTFTACKWTAGLWSTEDRIITNRWQIFPLWLNYFLRAESRGLHLSTRGL